MKFKELIKQAMGNVAGVKGTGSGKDAATFRFAMELNVLVRDYPEISFERYEYNSFAMKINNRVFCVNKVRYKVSESRMGYMGERYNYYDVVGCEMQAMNESYEVYDISDMELSDIIASESERQKKEKEAREKRKSEISEKANSMDAAIRNALTILNDIYTNDGKDVFIQAISNYKDSNQVAYMIYNRICWVL